MNNDIEKMLDEIRQAVANCPANERDTYDALMGEAEFWKMRLQELEQEDAE